MEYTVTGESTDIDFGASGVSEILQNVRTIMTTPKGSVPLRRGWFVDYSLLDQPLEVAKARLRAEIYEAVRQYEPRVEVTEIGFADTSDDLMSGRLIPRVKIEIIEE